MPLLECQLPGQCDSDPVHLPVQTLYLKDRRGRLSTGWMREGGIDHP
jgi:hypothetical protein